MGRTDMPIKLIVVHTVTPPNCTRTRDCSSSDGFSCVRRMLRVSRHICWIEDHLVEPVEPGSMGTQ